MKKKVFSIGSSIGFIKTSGSDKYITCNPICDKMYNFLQIKF